MPEPARRFEDLVAWQRARDLTKGIYLATREHGFARDFGLSRQIERASVSVTANIAEGFERKRPAEFRLGAGISTGSPAVSAISPVNRGSGLRTQDSGLGLARRVASP